MKEWIQSYAGNAVTPLRLKKEQVHFSDIPHALAQKVRFNGHLREMGYTVAQHCVIGAGLISGPFALAFLLHEVSEVYLPDIPAPIKGSLIVSRQDIGDISWSTLEDEHADVIFDALHLSSLRPLLDAPEVKLMDLRMLMTEKRDLMGPMAEEIPWATADISPLDYRITDIWGPTEAENLFIDVFERLSTSYGYLQQFRTSAAALEALARP